MNIPYEIRGFPWSRALFIAQKESNTFIINLAKIKARDNSFNQVFQTVTKEISAFCQKKRNDIFNFLLTDLQKYQISVLQDNIAKLFLKENGFIDNVITLPKEETLIPFLFYERCDIIALTYFTLDDFDTQIKALGFPNASVDLYLAANINTPDNLIDKFRNALFNSN